MTRRSGHNAENVALLHDHQFFTVDLNFSAGPFAKQNLVASFDIHSNTLAIFVFSARANRDDFAFLRFFLGGVGNNEAA